jgi:hypothetical protein
MSDVFLFAWWYAQGMPEISNPRKKSMETESHSQESDGQQTSEFDDADSSIDFVEDEVQEQLDIINVLLLRSRASRCRIASLQHQIEIPALHGSEVIIHHAEQVGLVDRDSRSTSSITIDDTNPLKRNYPLEWFKLSSALTKSQRSIREITRTTHKATIATDQISGFHRSEISEDTLSFFSKIRHRRYDEVAAALSSDPSLCTDPRDEFGNTPLMVAAQAIHFPIPRSILKDAGPFLHKRV